MKYSLIAPVTHTDACSQVLSNRGIEQNSIAEYINASFEDVNNPELLGEDKLKQGAQMVAEHAQKHTKTILIVDPDVDGNSSSSVLLNYLYDLFPDWTTEIKPYFHTGKQHGLNDCIDYILENDFGFAIVPDAGSNDTNECKLLKEKGIDVLILDHHDFDKENPYALIINNQDKYSNYPNKALSGVGVVWQFCRYVDKIMHTDYAMKYLDLVAIGLVGDMMDIRSIETRVLIRQGLDNLHNPFIYHMAQKNAFKLGSVITPMGAAFYIVPLLNAIQRSGTLEEKQLVFKSMVQYLAFEEVPSTKRGHKLGETERIVDQAVRTCTNVKNRQTRVQDASIEAIEKKIKDEHLLDHKVLLILLDNDNIPAEVRGLIANKFMAKYQRPCCLLSKGDGRYSGSARGCSIAGVDDFKQICLDTDEIEYAIGHPNAYGISIREENIQSFIDKTDIALKDMSDEAIYYVDYIFEGQKVEKDVLLDIAGMSVYWGTELDEPYIAIEGLKVTPEMVTIFEKRDKTVKILLNNGVSIMKFNASDDFCQKIKDNNTGYVELDIVGRCNANEWNGLVTPQVFIEDYNITDSNKYYF